MSGKAAPPSGEWPLWTPPTVHIVAPDPIGAAEADWAVEVRETLTAGDEAGRRPLVGLGSASAFALRDRARDGPGAVLLASPTDSELPEGVRDRLRLIAEEAGAVVVAAEASSRPGRSSAVAALVALGAARSVSVVVPNYNYGRYIGERLLQIDRQAYPVSEIIVLDDASSDDSLAVIRSAIARMRTPVRLIVNPRNSGSAFRQWIKGVAAARGELVWIAEADDLAAPDFLARLAPAFDAPGLVMAQSQSRQVGPDGEVRYDDYGFYLEEVGAERWRRSHLSDGRDHAASTLGVMNTIPNVSAVLFRTEALRQSLAACAPALEGFRLAGDWLVYLEVLSRGGFAYCAHALNDHRVHEASVTTSALTPLDRVLEVARLQKTARDRLGLPAATVEAATAYLQKLYDYFGLAGPDRPGVYDHPAFAPLAPEAAGGLR